jgi:glucose/arabinose dehydrogenase
MRDTPYRAGLPAFLTSSIALTVLLGACSDPVTVTGPGPEPGVDGIALTQIAAGLSSPVYLAAKPGDDRLFVVEQTGTIRIITGGEVLSSPFLDITSKTQAGGERGLLSVAFHPEAGSTRFFVNYTDRDGDTVVERYEAIPGQNVADASSGITIMTVEQPFGNHNGGQLQFGPDGRLYVGMGDGGSGGDPQGHGQDLSTLLGAMLRLDVDGSAPYAIPSDNPYANDGGRPEIWASGLRNPWRFSFDGQNGDLYIADVGQNRLEEINVVPPDDAGVNYGWNTMEGSECFGGGGCDPGAFTLPVLEYDHAEGCSVTGGYVYRGSRMPGLVGHYFYADYCEGWIRSFHYTNGAATDQTEWELPDVGRITSFGEDAEGELYVLTAAGGVFRIDLA